MGHCTMSNLTTRVNIVNYIIEVCLLFLGGANEQAS
jgi:hypothetical protein